MLEKTEEAIKNGQSKDTGNIGHTKHRTKINKTQSTTQKTKKMRPKSEGEQFHPLITRIR
jgi:hypothetical protein